MNGALAVVSAETEHLGKHGVVLSTGAVLVGQLRSLSSRSDKYVATLCLPTIMVI
jgi:hypothetical protein